MKAPILALALLATPVFAASSYQVQMFPDSGGTWAGTFTTFETTAPFEYHPVYHIEIDTGSGILEHTVSDETYCALTVPGCHLPEGQEYDHIPSYYLADSSLSGIGYVTGGAIHWMQPGQNNGVFPPYFWYLDPFDDQHGVFYQGTYTISPIPLPPAFWLLASALPLLRLRR